MEAGPPSLGFVVAIKFDADGLLLCCIAVVSPRLQQPRRAGLVAVLTCVDVDIGLLYVDMPVFSSALLPSSVFVPNSLTGLGGTGRSLQTFLSRHVGWRRPLAPVVGRRRQLSMPTSLPRTEPGCYSLTRQEDEFRQV